MVESEMSEWYMPLFIRSERITSHIAQASTVSLPPPDAAEDSVIDTVQWHIYLPNCVSPSGKKTFGLVKYSKPTFIQNTKLLVYGHQHGNDFHWGKKLKDGVFKGNGSLQIFTAVILKLWGTPTPRGCGGIADGGAWLLLFCFVLFNFQKI